MSRTQPLIPFTVHIENFRELPSTSSYLLEQARDGAAEGLVIQADYQSEGRGKPGREWKSPAGKNLLFSLLIRPPLTSGTAPMLTQICCRSVAAVLRENGIEAGFKRPNDLLAGGKKICGTLVESSSRGNRLEYAVIGIGLNVNALASELPSTATSMKLITGKTFCLDVLLRRILRQMGEDLASFYRN